MRAVFVNHCHPEMPHVCALRQRKFAEAMAVCGHKIVLLTESLPGQTSDKPPSDLNHQLDAHDWAKPYILPITPEQDSVLTKLRNGAFPAGVRQAVILLCYLFSSGLYGDWRKASRPYLSPLVRTFKPEVVWASFGNTGVWNIAQDVADEADCPWVADIKDNWQNFIPMGLRRLMAARYKNAVHMTTFSEGQSAEADLWFHQQKSVVYSGFDNVAKKQKKTDGAEFTVLLSGSIYREDKLDEFIAGLELWLKNRNPKAAKPVCISYVGNDQTRVALATKKLSHLCRLDIGGFLPIDHLIERQAQADVNAYIRLPGSYIYHLHHKLFEMLDADKPILVYPEEVPESVRIADDVGGTLHSCASPHDINSALTACEIKTDASVNSQKLAYYSWQRQAEILERVLDDARRKS